MLRIGRLFALLMISFSVNALDANSIFYPLPSQTQGQFLTAKKLFPNPKGGIWVQDIRNHIHFYDGQHLLTNKNRSLDGNTENMVYADGDFWFTEANKLYRLSSDGQRDVVLNLVNAQSFIKVGYSSGKIWAFSAKFFHSYDLTTGKVRSIPTVEITQAAIGEDVQIESAVFIHQHWVVSTQYAVFLLGDTGIKKLTGNEITGINKIYYDQQQDRILLATQTGVKWLNGTTGALQPQSIGSEDVTSIAISATDYWIGTQNGLLVYNIHQASTTIFQANYQDDYSLANNSIFDLALDQKGGIWIATARGVSYYSQSSAMFKRVRFGTQKNQIPFGRINNMLVNNDGDSWLATTTGLYRIHAAKNGDKAAKVERIMTGNIRSIVRVKSQYWLTRDNELWCFDPITYHNQKINVEEGRFNDTITHLSADSAQTLWFSTASGLYRYFPTNNSIKNFSLTWMQKGTINGDITDLYADKYGRVWIGTDHGLYEYHKGRILFDTFSAEFGGTDSISQVSDKTLWAVNNYGVISIDIAKSRVVPVPLQDSNSSALCVATAANGTWLATTKGISFYNPAGLLVKHFSSPFGMVSNEFLPDGCALSPDGNQLVLSSKLGLVQASTPQLLMAQLPENNVIVGEVLLDRSRVAISPNPDRELHLSYGKSVTFLFGVLPDLDVPHLQYRLVGSHKHDWVSLQGSQVTFNKLSPGSYAIEFKALSQFGSNKKNTQYRFIIDKPWYLTSWFAILTIVLMLLLILAIFVWRARAMMSKNIRLRRLINLKTNQLKHQSQLLISSNAELRRQAETRESLINEVSEEAAACIENIKINMDQYSKSTQLELLQQSLSYLEQISLLHLSSEKKVIPQGKMVSLVIKAITQGWQLDAENAGVKLVVYDETPNCMIRVRYANFDTVLNSLLASALIRAKKGQDVTLSTKLKDNQLQVIVQDQGIGISESEILAYEAQEFGLDITPITHKPLNTTLAVMAELVQQNGGTFSFTTNTITQVTQLIVTWPIDGYRINALAEGVISTKSSEILDTDALVDMEEIDSKHLQINGSEGDDKVLIDLKEQWLTKVYDLVEQNFSDPDFGTSVAAKLLFVSERSLQRKFKNLTERSFMDYLTQYRLEKACEMLMSGYKVADTAFESGFNDPSYFSQRFKTHFGLTPSKFIENTQQD
ncbi:helix-turn-helix domain-containing protein [Vibrio algicola]|nr:helix-turn-helix domain-containing protein [Vibrio algicola]